MKMFCIYLYSILAKPNGNQQTKTESNGAHKIKSHLLGNASDKGMCRSSGPSSGCGNPQDLGTGPFLHRSRQKKKEVEGGRVSEKNS